MVPVKPTESPAKRKAKKVSAMECFEKSAAALGKTGDREMDRAAQWRLLGIAISEHNRFPEA